MKTTRKIFITMSAVIFLILLAACENSSDESGTLHDNQSQNNNVSQNNRDDSRENASNTGAANTNHNENENADASNNEKENSSAYQTPVNLKEEYLKKLDDTKLEMDEMRNNPADSSTFALKKVENDRYDVWDGLLNEVYGVLKVQLPAEEMDQLREEQREWIDYRDKTALEASQKYKGGTQEHLEYVAVLADVTEERCFELVRNYMQ